MNSSVPAWRFRTLGADEVETEPTQRDQFNNDEVGLADALVRESIQNSTDAPTGPTQTRSGVGSRHSALTLRRVRSVLSSWTPTPCACS